jgi:hypothetical protein
MDLSSDFPCSAGLQIFGSGRSRLLVRCFESFGVSSEAIVKTTNKNFLQYRRGIMMCFPRSVRTCACGTFIICHLLRTMPMGTGFAPCLLSSIIISVVYLLDLVRVKSILTTSLISHKWNNKLFSYIIPRTSQDLFGETKLTSFSKYPLEKHSPDRRSPPIGLFRSSLFVDPDINQTKEWIGE